jgi:hypothetical protein
MDKIDASLLKYATGWSDAVFQRAFIGFIGLVVLVLVVRAVVRRDSSPIAALLWTLLGLVLLVFSMIPQQVVDFVIATDYMTRIRTVMGAISLLMLLITFEAVRRTHLQERYALLWVTTSGVILLCVLFPGAVALFRAITGMEYGAAVAAVAFTFLILVAFNFSISFSTMQSNQSKMAQKIAILEERLRQLESEHNGQDASRKMKE